MRRLFAFFVALLLFGGGVLLLGAGFSGSASLPPEGPPTSEGPSDPPSDDPSEPDPDDDGDEESCKAQEVVRDYLAEQGFRRRNFVVGHGALDWGSVPGEHTNHRFSLPLRSQRAVNQFLSGDSARSVAARDLVGDEVAGRWVPVQFLSPVKYTGNYYWKGSVVKGGSERALAGDIWWFNVDARACVLDPSDSIRAVCGNVGLDSLALATHGREE